MSTRERILNNDFLLRLRNELVVATPSLNALVADLKQLSIEMADETSIEKRLMEFLHIHPSVIRSIAISLQPHRVEFANQLHEIADELDDLILQCLSSDSDILDY